jgi:hypothetical protein
MPVMHCEKQFSHFAVTLEMPGSDSLTGQSALIRLAQVDVHAADAQFEFQSGITGICTTPLREMLCQNILMEIQHS